jgi:hypothetical protein
LGGGGEPFVGGSYGAGEDPDEIVAAQRRTQTTGWRKAVSVMTFGLIKPGPSAKQQRDEELIRRIRASLLDVYVIAFVNSKGGVGKTTMAVAAGNAIARERGDRVIVVDVDTDLGNLSARFREHGGPKANIEALASLPNAGSSPTCGCSPFRTTTGWKCCPRRTIRVPRTGSTARTSSRRCGSCGLTTT